jgi:hypothetical protein
LNCRSYSPGFRIPHRPLFGLTASFGFHYNLLCTISPSVCISFPIFLCAVEVLSIRTRDTSGCSPLNLLLKCSQLAPGPHWNEVHGGTRNTSGRLWTVCGLCLAYRSGDAGMVTSPRDCGNGRLLATGPSLSDPPGLTFTPSPPLLGSERRRDSLE